MKSNSFIACGAMLMASIGGVMAQTISSPDGKTVVNIECKDGKPSYSVVYDGTELLQSSPLGLVTNVGDYSQGLTLSKTSALQNVVDDYTLYNLKSSHNHYEANAQTYTFSQDGKEVLTVNFEVSDNNVAFRYQLLPKKETKSCVISGEATGFVLPEGTTTFMCPQMQPMTGFARTAPSYETRYEADGEMGKNGWGLGYTFPCLFKAQNEHWVLISETGVDGTYCASKLENRGANKYQLSFPDARENNGYGSNTVQAELPSYTPWRTITVGNSLKPIVETTVTWDVLKCDDVKMQARMASNQKYGRGAWSWIIANDESCNYDTQKEYIDFAAAMGWESLLIDAMWDVQIGRERIAELAQYGRQKGVYLYLWYNSNGVWNDAPQSPRHCMDTSHHRRAEMEWMKNIGIRGIKVDFFGGDKQCTMQLYEDILRDAEDFGLMVIFHGCTLPRGWERMYPNFVACEAVRASENLHFGQDECDNESKNATYMPFIRNTVGSMDFGGSTLNWYYNPKNSSEMWGGHRVTSDVFALATAILFQSPVQHFAMAPNNLNDAPAWAVDFMKHVPTTWDEVKYISGYPGKNVILARRTGDSWYVAGVNGEKEPLKVRLSLSMFAPGTQLAVYSDDMQLKGGVKTVTLGKNQTLDVVIPFNGGLVIKPAFANQSRIVEEGGTGKYKAIMQEVPGLEAHTVLLPQDLSKFNKKNPLPVLVWGNGACRNSPWEHYLFLNEIASQGYLVIATGYYPREGVHLEGPMSTPQQQIESIDWVLAQNSNPKSPLYGKVNTRAICAAGMSCGGLQTLFNCADPRITTYMICNSGLFIDPSIAMPNMPMPGKEQLKSVHGPILYMLGGTEDIAYQNGMDDFHRINHVPAVAINYPVGHGGTYAQPHGGEFSIPAIAWLNWQLKGDKVAAQMFEGKDCGIATRPDWMIEKNALVK